MAANPKRTLILTMILLVIIGFGIAQLYYKGQNKYVDPRVVEARELYSKYNEYAQANNFSAVFSLLDSIEYIYTNIPHYAESYEIGVLYNNRAASYLTMALHFEDSSLSLNGIEIISKDSLLNLGKLNAQKSIMLYENWLQQYGEKELSDIESQIKHKFLNGIDVSSEKEKAKYMAKRMEEIETAQYETPRRLSVSYTNLGIVERHKENYKGAIELYSKALDLWERNLTAKNNINILLGRPIEKGRIIHKFFPPDKEKK